MKNFRIQYSRNRQIEYDQIPFKHWKGAPYSCFPRRPLEIELFYFMPSAYYTCLSSWDLSGIEDESQKKKSFDTYLLLEKENSPYLLTYLKSIN